MLWNVESVYFIIVKLLISDYFWATNEEWKLGDFGLIFCQPVGFKKSGYPGYSDK